MFESYKLPMQKDAQKSNQYQYLPENHLGRILNSSSIYSLGDEIEHCTGQTTSLGVVKNVKRLVYLWRPFKN